MRAGVEKAKGLVNKASIERAVGSGKKAGVENELKLRLKVERAS